ncbi:MAG: hypothetical protein FD177_1697 [Desulfovibrionaceae bacterium]|nr:MAG: hypothetical protein FD177_1697 [Desulfovibrionaceae bacterium]
MEAVATNHEAAMEAGDVMTASPAFPSVFQPPTVSTGSFRFLHPSEYMAQPALPRWLIRNYLEDGSLVCVFGDPGSFKTFAAIDQGLCVATGTPWHGHDIPNPGHVFYIVGEGAEGLTKRVRAWCVDHGKDPLTVPFYLSSVPAQFLSEESTQAVFRAVEAMATQYGPPKLIVVDTLSRNFGDGDENSQRDMGLFVAKMDMLKAKWGCCVMTVHHTGWSDKSRVRGSSVLRGALDFEYNMKRKGDAVVMSCSKCKDHAEPADLVFEPKTIGVGWTDPETGQEITSCVLQLTHPPVTKKASALSDVQRKVLDALEVEHNERGGPVKEKDWREAAYMLNIVKGDEQDSKRKAFARAKVELEERGLVQKEDGLWSPVR